MRLAATVCITVFIVFYTSFCVAVGGVIFGQLHHTYAMSLNVFYLGLFFLLVSFLNPFLSLLSSENTGGLRKVTS